MGPAFLWAALNLREVALSVQPRVIEFPLTGFRTDLVELTAP
jgi:hypothetical protein